MHKCTIHKHKLKKQTLIYLFYKYNNNNIIDKINSYIYICLTNIIMINDNDNNNNNNVIKMWFTKKKKNQSQ